MSSSECLPIVYQAFENYWAETELLIPSPPKFQKKKYQSPHPGFLICVNGTSVHTDAEAKIKSSMLLFF